MFQIQTLKHWNEVTTTEIKDPHALRDAYDAILLNLQSSSRLRREILESNEFPLVFQALREPQKLCGISWRLEKQELKHLYLMLRKNVSALVPVGSSSDEIEAAYNEIVAVYKLLKQAVKNSA